MSRSSANGAVEYAVETASTGWAEASAVFGSRLAVLGEVDVSGLEHAKVDAQRTVQYVNDGTMPVRTTMGGTFKTDIWLPGHGSTTAGVVALEEHEDVLGYVVGNAASTGTGTTASGSPTVTSIPTAAANGLTPGGIVFPGSLGDAGGDGQAAVVATHAGSVLALLTALGAAPAAAAVIASSVMIHPTESPTAAALALRSMRLRALSANQHYSMHGCWPQQLTLSGFNPGEIPRASVTWGVSRWSAAAATFPSAVAVDAFNPAPSAGGSLFVQARGTATRQTYKCRSFELNVDLGIKPVKGPGGVDGSQDTIGAVRGPQVVTVTFTVDAEDATATPTWGGRWDSDSQFYHLLFNANGAATGKRVAIYLPNCCIVDRKPVQMSADGVNRERITMRAYTGPTATSELTLSAWRLALG